MSKQQESGPAGTAAGLPQDPKLVAHIVLNQNAANVAAGTVAAVRGGG